ncbi:MAG TPA: flagellar biosynthesis protein FliQ [Blastocatellia bacterium]|jgi:flagellar biosynthetic protein FliQ|nr:flagellar biosynthesis protein FliQ [Blastocatellia bacterium]
MNTYIQAAGESLWLILLLAAPALLASLLVGLLVSLLQALTQVQEQTLTFVPKIIATFLALIIAANWMLGRLLAFTQHIFDLVLRVGTGD